MLSKNELLAKKDFILFAGACIVSGNYVYIELENGAYIAFNNDLYSKSKTFGVVNISVSTVQNSFCQKADCFGGSCYAKKMERLNPRLKPILENNLDLLSSYELTKGDLYLIREAFYQLKNIGLVSSDYFRFNKFGEVVNPVHARNYVAIARTLKGLFNCVLWSKNMGAFDGSGYEHIENLKVILSNPILNTDDFKTTHTHDALFNVYDDMQKQSDDMQKQSDDMTKTNKAIECNGRSCLECGYKCYKMKKGQNIKVYETLRKNGGRK